MRLPNYHKRKARQPDASSSDSRRADGAGEDAKTTHPAATKAGPDAKECEENACVVFMGHSQPYFFPPRKAERLIFVALS